MNTFTYKRTASVDDALVSIGSQSTAKYLGGGTNLIDLMKTGVEDFTTNFGADDEKAMVEYLADVNKNRSPFADWKDGYEATVIAIKAHEAVMKNGRVELADELFKVS